MNLGNKVKTRRIELQMSQDELAQKMGYKSRSSINKIENGRPVSQKIITRLADVLDTSVVYLMGLEDNKGKEQGERIRKVRKELDLTLEEFADKLGVTKQTISHVEDGLNNLTEQLTRRICREYHVNYEYLIYGKGEMFGNLQETILNELSLHYNLDDWDREILSIYLDMPKEMKFYIKREIKKRFFSDLNKSE